MKRLHYASSECKRRKVNDEGQTMNYQSRYRWAKRSAFNNKTIVDLTDYSNSNTSNIESSPSSRRTVDSFLSLQSGEINQHSDNANTTTLQLAASNTSDTESSPSSGRTVDSFLSLQSGEINQHSDNANTITLQLAASNTSDTESSPSSGRTVDSFLSSNTSDTESSPSSRRTVDSFLSSQSEEINQHSDNANTTKLQLAALHEDSEDVFVNDISDVAVSEDKASDCSHCNDMHINDNDMHINDILLNIGMENFENNSNQELYGLDTVSMPTQCIFENNKETVDEAVYKVLNSYIKNNKTISCLRDDLQILQYVLPKPNRMPTTVFKLFKYISNLAPPCEILTHYCCRFCKYYCGIQRPIICAACNSNDESVQFYEVNIIDQIRFLFQHKNLADILDTANSIRNKDENIISDITDGSEYKRINFNRGQYDLTLILSTDGARLKNSSDSNLWPVSLMIAEVPSTNRNHFLLYVSIWYADMKPEMNSYLLPVCVRLDSILRNGGLTWIHPRTGLTYTTKVTAPLVVADAPARAMVQNIHNFNGTYGCNMCEVKTRRIRREKGKRRMRVYKYRCKELRLRTNERMNIFGKVAEKSQKIIKGLKGRAIVRLLPGADISTMVFPEILHSVALGVVKQMIILWIEKPGEWNIKNHLHDIDIFLLQIKPPNYFHRLPRCLSEYKLWKGYEYLYWALFYSVLAIEKYLPHKYMQHWILFVISLNILLQDKIQIHPDLEEAECLMQTFVAQFEDLYGERELSYNIHQMLHLGLSTRRWGPLSQNSAFQFENFIGCTSKMVHGSKHIGKEIINKIKICQGIQIIQNRVELMKISSQRSRIDQTLGKCVSITFSEDEIHLLHTIGALPENVNIYSRARIKNEIFTSKLYKSIKTLSYIVRCTFENSIFYGFIRFFVIHDETLFCIIDPYSINHSKILYHSESRSIINHIVPITSGNLLLILRVKDLHLSKVLQIGNYVCVIPTFLRKNTL